MNLKMFILLCAKKTVACCYKMMVMFSKIDDDKIVIFNYRQHQLEGNLKMVFEEIKEQFPKKNIYVQTSTKKMSLQLLGDLWLIRNASKVIVDDYFLAAYLIKPRAETHIIQLWHATGAFKKFGLSTKNTQFGPSDSYLKIIPIHSNYDEVYVSTDISAKYFAEAFAMDRERIFALGTPRVEQLANRELLQPFAYSERQQQMLKVLIAPTYRAQRPYKESNMDWVTEVKNLLAELADNVLLIIVLHPYEDREQWRGVEQERVIIDDRNNSNVWMEGVDCFVTDYSSALFEFAIFEKPLANYVPDLQQYSENRGLYRPLEDITDGAILRNRQQLVSWIAARQLEESHNTVRMVTENIGNTKNSTKKVVEHIFRVNRG